MAAPVEKKVTAGTVATYLASTGLLAILAAAKDNAELVGFLPDALAPFILAIVPTAIAFVSGWAAKHSPRIHA
ncbi:holin [Streptomyces sp. NPDC060064]|uniref:holin n=1 Tax=Streptomyces sp. NPDC060064 TaxID=3347049 RepID=UPI00368A9B37